MLTSDEIKEAMHTFAPVEFNGIVYDRITAYIYRVVKDRRTGRYTTTLQVELADRCERSVVVAPANKINLHERNERDNE